MFGIVPGQKYGWPKNLLHWHGINESILDICATVPIHFVIADGVIAMEGNGPLQGTARNLRKVRKKSERKVAPYVGPSIGALRGLLFERHFDDLRWLQTFICCFVDFSG
jgi:hypothetical protein